MAASTPPSMIPKEFAGLTIQSKASNRSKKLLTTSTLGRSAKCSIHSAQSSVSGSTRINLSNDSYSLRYKRFIGKALGHGTGTRGQRVDGFRKVGQQVVQALDSAQIVQLPGTPPFQFAQSHI